MEIIEQKTSIIVIYNGVGWVRDYDHNKKSILWGQTKSNSSGLYKYFNNCWYRWIIGKWIKINYTPDIELDYQKLLRGEKLNRILDKDF